MRSPDKINQYLNMVCRQIRFKETHSRVSKELKNHILDGRDYFISQGLNENEALEKAIADTGNAKTIGRQLNKIHRPAPAHGLRFSLSMKTLFRTPFKTAMTFLLIVAAAFALFSRVTDYAVTSREMKEAESRYRGVAALDNGVPNTYTSYMYSSLPPTVDILATDINFRHAKINYETPNALTIEQMSLFSALPGANTDMRYMTGGIISDYKRLNPFYAEQFDWGYDYNARFIIEGTFVQASVTGVGDDLPISEWEQPWYAIDFALVFDDVKHIAGTPITEEGGTAYIADYAKDNTLVRYTGAAAMTWSLSHTDDSGEEFMFYAYLDSDPSKSVFLLADNPYGWDFMNSLEAGSRYLIIGRTVANTVSLDDLITMHDDIYSQMEEVKPLEEYDFEGLIIGDAHSAWYGDNFTPRIGDQDTIGYVNSFHELDGLPENYLETAEFSRVKEIVDITDKDAHTFDIVYTSNMAAIPRFNEGAMTIREGRSFTQAPEDENACVVSWYFLETYGLNVGDKLTVDLGDRLFEQHAGLGAITYIPERQWDIADTVELEIVGVYFDTDPQHVRNAQHYRGYSPNTIFVPLSLLPVEVPENHKIMPGEFSIVIENPREIDAFLAAAEPLAEELGIELRFSDGGWAAAKEHIDTSRFTALLTAVLYILAAALALLLAAYLYIGRNKKAYAIMRALGVPRRKTGSALALPLGILSSFAILTGGIVGLVYTSGALKTALESLSETGYAANTSLPLGVVILCLLSALGLTSLFALLFLRKMGKTPPLVLLQGDVIRVGEIKNTETVLNKKSNPPALSEAHTIAFTPPPQAVLPPAARRYSAFRHVSSYIFRHMRRVKLKTTISLTLAFILTGAIGALTLTNVLYRELYKTAPVKTSATEFSSEAVKELSSSELAENLYFHSNHDVSLNRGDYRTPLILTNDLERSLEGAFSDNYTIEYAPDYSDTSFFYEDNDLCILGSDIAEILNVKAGDNLTMTNWTFFDAMNGFYFANEDYRDIWRTAWESDNLTEKEFEEKITDLFYEEIEPYTKTYKVAGIIHSEHNDIKFGVFTPLGEAASVHGGRGSGPSTIGTYTIGFSEFTLADNEQLDKLTGLLDNLQTESRKHSTEAAYYTDTTELDNIRRVRDLLILLFPVAVTAAVLIGLTAPGLIIMQSSKEAAILRVLGTTKKRVRCMLLFEQIILCALGLVFAAGGLIIYNSGLFMQSAETFAVCGALYLLGCVCAGLVAAVSVTKRKVLELLQVKE